jgi:hypothetical protein
VYSWRCTVRQQEASERRERNDVIGKRIGTPDYQMTAGVDSRNLPRSDPLNDIQRPPTERFLDRERHLVKKNTELCPLLEKTFASTCLGGSDSLNRRSEGHPNSNATQRLSALKSTAGPIARPHQSARVERARTVQPTFGDHCRVAWERSRQCTSNLVLLPGQDFAKIASSPVL